MIWNVTDANSRGRLREELDKCYEKLAGMRATRRRLIKQYVGDKYQAEGQKTRTIIVNLLYQVAMTYQLSLAGSCPKFKIVAQQPMMGQVARKWEVNLNSLARRLKLEQVIQEIVLNAIFKWGIAKIGRGDSIAVDLDNDIFTDPTYPFVASISPDRWVHDTEATSTRSLRFAGDHYWVEWDKLEASDRVDQKVLKRLRPGPKPTTNALGEEMVSSLSGGLDANDRDRDGIEVQDLWYPDEQRMFTFDYEMQEGPLFAAPQSGHPQGPYRYLGFGPVPDNSVPVSITENLEELHHLANSCMRKLARQAKGSKHFNAYEPGGEQDAKAMNQALEGQSVAVTDVDRVKPVTVPGPDPAIQVFRDGVINDFDRAAGNLSALAGLGAQAPTLGQEELIHQQATGVEAQYLYRTQVFIGEIGEELATLMWNDPIGYPGQDSLADNGFPDVTFDSTFIPAIRQGRISDYQIAVEPYSHVFIPPQSKADGILQTISQVILPLAQTPWAQEQGMGLDIQETVNLIADLKNQPELRTLITFMGAPQETGAPSSDIRQSPTTTRTNVRKNVSTGGTPQAQQQSKMQALMKSAGNAGQNAA